MLDNSFRARYGKLPIATYAIAEPPLKEAAAFMTPHHHSEFEVIAVVHGTCEVVIDQNIYLAQGGDILLIPPYSLHSGYVMPGDSFSHFCFCFDMALLDETDFIKKLESGYLTVTNLVRRASPVGASLYGTAQCIYQQCTAQRKGWDYIVRGQLMAMVGLLVQSDTIYSVTHTAARQDFCTQVLNLLGQSYADAITSHDIAQRLSYSQSHFCRLFRENFSFSFQQYLCRYRLSKARQLLAQGDLSVSEAAVQVGFNNLSYFSRQFRAMCGCTPKQFQQLQMNPDSYSNYYLTPSAQGTGTR
ncbi:MAG: AraC family transcriptional regulator [Ruthenibacterium sp.]